ncbi:MAG: FAD-linked oxidase C-terminal domain-containing protein [Burkholderiales bacterium]
MKVEELRRYKTPIEMGLFRSIKSALDPQGIINPGKIL